MTPSDAPGSDGEPRGGLPVHTLAACPGCGSGASTPVELGSDHPLRRCTDCQLVYAAVYGEPEAIYVDGYLKGETDFGLSIFDPLFQEFLDFAAEKRLQVIEGLRPAKGRLLDVGCGSGEVLRVAQRRGWEVAGAEPVAESAQIARDRGLDVRTAMLEDSGLPTAEWDVVSAFHVLEHVPDGAGFLRSIARWARPGGLVVIEVPNWGSVDRERKGRHWPGLRPLEHIGHYSPATLERTFRQAGLEPVLVRSMGFLWRKQTLEQQLDDLARASWGRLLRRPPLSRDGEQAGQPARVPSGLARRALLATQAAYDRRGKGQVVLGAARVPG